MKKWILPLLRARGINCVLGSTLTLLLGGCGPLSDQILAEFVLDLARGAIAGWLL
jgi:hypothetical protein